MGDEDIRLRIEASIESVEGATAGRGPESTRFTVEVLRAVPELIEGLSSSGSAAAAALGGALRACWELTTDEWSSPAQLLASLARTLELVQEANAVARSAGAAPVVDAPGLEETRRTLSAFLEAGPRDAVRDLGDVALPDLAGLLVPGADAPALTWALPPGPEPAEADEMPADAFDQPFTATPVPRGARDDAAGGGGRLYEVWYGTNRVRRDGAEPAELFGTSADPDGRVHFGTCSVEIPKSHRFGSLGTPWWKRWARFELTDDHLRLREVKEQASGDAFFGAMKSELGGLREGDRQALVYLHGYNVAFEEAALRGAQMGFDLKVPGVTAFYSWPSSASLEGYFADQDRIEASEPQIAEFLVRMVRDSGARKVHLLAHSMGNRGLARAIQRIAAQAHEAGDVRFGQIILAAPDVSVGLFKEIARVYPELSERTTLYASAKDRALAMSKFLQDATRAGFTPPITVVPGIDTVEVTDIDVTLLGHGYYGDAEAVLYDMSQLLTANAEPAMRPRLRAVDGTDGPYWRIGA